ncbi:glycosyltransferase [Georgenia wutianyii]|uniref:glycosyltransferase n=1 Tax=Georgenia wutianyii TaxID=2585135 RepID=UPI00143CE6C9|nr:MULTISPECIES: glycosyltransferase family 2 protein [Georgenia]
MTAVAAPTPAAAEADPDVLVAVVTYNSAPLIEGFLRALPAALAGAGTARVVVVDNGSRDGTPDLVRTVAPWAVVLEVGANRGYAAGINLALSCSSARRGSYVLNPDAIPSPGSVDRLARAVETDTGLGIAVPRIVDEQGRLKLSLRREPTLWRALGEATLGGRRASRVPLLGEVVGDVDRYVDGATADWATGAAMFIAPRTVERVGPWSEDFFLYSEETDFALRTRDAGLRLALVADASVMHPGGELGTSPWLWSLAAVNRTRLYRRRHRALPSAAYWSAVLLNEVLRVRRGPQHREAVRALLRGVRFPVDTAPGPVQTGGARATR